MNCARCEDRSEYRLRLVMRQTVDVKTPKGERRYHAVRQSPLNVRCEADPLHRWCGVKGRGPIEARPWCPRRREIER